MSVDEVIRATGFDLVIPDDVPATREPSAEEFKDIRLNVWMLAHAGFAVEDASNAPFIAPWAWMWARGLKPNEGQTRVAAETGAVVQGINERITGVESTLKEFLAKIDPAVLATGVANAMPPLMLEHRVGPGFLQTALRDSFSLLWVWIATVCIGTSGFVGWTFGARHERSRLETVLAQEHQQLARAQQIIDRLVTTAPKP